MNDYYVDGRCITAEDKYQARRIYAKTVGVAANEVRDWNYAEDGYPLEPQHQASTCTVCPATPDAEDTYGDWTTDDSDRLYCPDHNDVNPTSDNYRQDAA